MFRCKASQYMMRSRRLSSSLLGFLIVYRSSPGSHKGDLWFVREPQVRDDIEEFNMYSWPDFEQDMVGRDALEERRSRNSQVNF